MGINVEAHITGTIFKIQTAQGAEVSAGQPLIILESMKMEMPIEAPVSGRVLEIRVQEGQSVEEGDILLVLE